MTGPAWRATCATLLILLAACSSAFAHGGERHVTRALRDGTALRLAEHGDPRHLGAGPGEMLTSAMGQAAAERAGAVRSGLATTWCGATRTTDDTVHEVDRSSYALHAVYAYPADKASRFGQYAPVIQQLMKGAADKVAVSGYGQQSLRIDLGTNCGPQYVDISVVPLPYTSAQLQSYASSHGGDAVQLLSEAARAVLDIPWDSGPRNLVIFADYHEWTGWGGQGYRPWDESPDRTNGSQYGAWDAAVYGYGRAWFEDSTSEYATTVTLHEITHTLGAVGDSAPHTTGAGHCFQEWDVMCYADGGPRGQPEDLSYACGGDELHEVYDCGLDDYFNEFPAPGSYLATHWNVARSLTMCPKATCESARSAPPLGLAVSTGTPFIGQTVHLTALPDPGGPTPLFYRWDYDGDHRWDSGFSSGEDDEAMFTGDPRVIGVQAIYPDGRTSTQAVQLSAKPETPSVSLQASTLTPQAGQAVTITATAGGESTPIIDWQWSDDEGPASTPDPQQLSRSWTTAGAHAVHVLAITSLGAVADAQITIDVQPAAGSGASGGSGGTGAAGGTTPAKTPAGTRPPASGVRGTTVTGSTTRPDVRLRLLGGRILALAGPRIALRGEPGTTAVVTLRVSRAVQRRLHLRSRVIARRDIRLEDGVTRIRLRVPRRVRGARLMRVPAQLVVAADDGSTVRRSVTLAR